ncbi:MAG: leucine-rich repeat protein, partial [Clostridia bacterium]|nr:leucine-rich repeat protein [Clostridia bacterium]
VVIGKWQAVEDGEGNAIPEQDRIVDTSGIVTIIGDTVTIVAKVTALNPAYKWSINGVEQGSLLTKDITFVANSAGNKEYVLTVTDIIGNVIASNTYEVMCYATSEEYEFVVENGVLVEYNGTDTMVDVPGIVGGKEIHTIGKDAFNGKADITQIILANTIHTIEGASNFVDGAFYGCSALTDVISKDNALNSIGAYAFYGCGALTNVSASMITNVGDYAFYNTVNLKQIGNREGVLNLTKALYVGIYAIYGNNAASKLYLDDVVTIGEFAIRGNLKLDTIYLGDSLVHVIYENIHGERVTENIATSRRTIIETVIAANTQIYVYNNSNVTSYFDAMYISYVTTNISSIEYTERVLVGDDYIVTAYATGLDITYAWYKDDVQTVIATTNIITINETASGNHTYRLVVTDSVGNSVERTITLTAVEYENELYFIVENGVLVEYLGVGTEVVVPTYINGTSGEIWITELGEAFKGNTTVTRVVLGLGVTAIADNAFVGATKLTTVMVTSALVTVGNNVFNGLTKFALFTIDGTTNDLSNLVSVGDNAFRDTKVDKVQLTNIESIGVNSFTNVSANLIMIGNKDGIVVTEGSNASEAIELTSRVFTDKNIYSPNEDVIAYVALNDIEGFTTLTATIAADNELVAKGDYVTFTATVVGQGVTYTWYANTAEIAGETEATLVTTHNATGEIVYTLKVTDAMGGEVTSNPVTIKYLINENYVNFVVENGVLISYIGSATEVVVPDYLDVTNFDTVIHTISATAFRGNSNITSIRFGDEVSLIEGITINEPSDNVNTAAFYGCSKLEEIKFDNTVEVTIGACAFYNCRALTTVTFSAEIINLGEYAFYSNVSLREVVGVNNITIGAYTFYDCSSLVQVGASNNVVKVKNTTLPEYAFFRCGSVSSFDLTEVTAIETCALNSCGGVTDLVLTQVTSIASSAIYTNTSNNVNIVINKDITSEGLKANSIGGTRVTLYSTMDSYVKTFAEANRINFVGVNMTGYEASYVYPINGEHTLSVVGTGYGNLTYAWSKNGSLVQTSASNELVISSTEVGTSTYRIMLTDSVGYSYTTEIEVTFVADYYEVNASIGTDGNNGVGGSVNTSSASVAYLDDYTITITIGSEYRLYTVAVNGENVDINLFNKNGNIYTYQVENVDNAQEIVVTTKILAYEVVVSADANVILLTNENMLVDSGNIAVISFSLNEHYVVDEILVDGVSVDLSSLTYEPAAEIYTYNLTNVTKDTLVNITARYATYSVSVDLSEGGSLASDITGSYVYGTSITITPIAENHYKLKEIKINGTVVALSGSYTFILESNTVVEVVFALEEMVLSVTTSGGATAQNKIRVPYGNDGAIVITSNASDVYSVEIDGNKVQNLNEIVSKDNGTYTITVANVTKNMSVTVIMGMYINIAGGEHVNTTPAKVNGKILVPYNTNQGVIMEALEGYILTSVKINDVEMLTSSVSRSSTSVAGMGEEQNVVIVTRKLYDVTSSITHGTLVTSTIFQVEDGSNAEVVFSVNDNYTLTSILVNGESFDLTSDNLVYNDALKQYTLTIENVTEDVVVAISASINKVQVVLTVDSNGSVKVGSNTYTNETVTIEMDYGSSLVMVIKPNGDYAVDSVVYNGANQDTTITTIANITNATNTLNVTFKLVQYAVQVSAGDNNVTIVAPSTQNVDSGSSATIQFRVAEHYHYDNIKVNGVKFAGQVTKVDGVYSFTITDIRKEHTVQVYSAIDTFTVSINNLTHGTVSPATSVSVSYGNGQTFAFTLDSGYELLAENVVITNVDSGQEITAGWSLNNNVLEIGMVRSDIEISVNVTRKTVYYNISFASNALVNPLNPAAQTRVEENTNYAFKFTIQANYEIVSVVINTTEFTGAVTKGDDGVYTFEYIVTTDMVVTVNVAIVKHSITVVVGDNGTVSPNANVVVNHGASQTFVITPNSNYDIDEVLLDGQKQTVTGNTLVVANVEKDMVLNVTFREKLA